MNGDSDTKKRIAFAAISAAIAVALGAFGAHSLAKQVSATALETWKTAAHYHLIHSVALLFLANLPTKSSLPRVLIATGMCIFAVTLYLLVLLNLKFLGAITPIGGALMIVGWIVLGIQCLKSINSPLT